uniref:Uncharacterized protein n=1 Tax=Arsenophonus nasoniae TaxID=638 RepID=D2TXH9_9GAMM|nr:hypothetical protein ARN_08010 [Arsenophonus nasoniae]
MVQVRYDYSRSGVRLKRFNMDKGLSIGVMIGTDFLFLFWFAKIYLFPTLRR